jgi:hypothetical protein
VIVDVVLEGKDETFVLPLFDKLLLATIEYFNQTYRDSSCWDCTADDIKKQCHYYTLLDAKVNVY